MKNKNGFKHCFPLHEPQFRPNEKKTWQVNNVSFSWSMEDTVHWVKQLPGCAVFYLLSRCGEAWLHLSQNSMGFSLGISKYKLHKITPPLPSRAQRGIFRTYFCALMLSSGLGDAENAHSPRNVMEGPKETQGSSSWISSFRDGSGPQQSQQIQEWGRRVLGGGGLPNFWSLESSM